MALQQYANAVSGLCWLPAGGSSTVYQQLPLHSVRVDATLYDLCAEVKIQQTYANDIQHPSLQSLECTYIFPLDEDSAVFSFEAELDGVSVKGHVREKSEARAEYKAALTSNRAAMLLEQSSDNIFQCKVGNLKFGSVCTITFTYLTVLEQEGRHNRLTLPMIIAPKYTPSNSGPTPPFPLAETAPQNTIHRGYHCHYCLCSPIIGTRHHCDECAFDFCHGCSTQHVGHFMDTYMVQSPPSPKLPAAACISTHTILQSKIKDLIIKLNITMPSPIVSIQCPSHPNETIITQSNNTSNGATAFFHSKSACSLSKDFFLLVEQQRCFEPRVLCELDVANHTAAVCLAFIPPPLDMLSASQIHCELVFLIDCSGSMRGSSIACVRECMQLLLRSLPVHSHFNVITFGSRWSSLFPSSQAYDDASLLAASHHIAALGANMGGTEIYPPLFHVLTSKVLPTHPRQVFLLTDGQVSNVKQLVQLTTQHAVNTRLFTFGIGNSVDRMLCKKLARAGRGKCEFVTAKDGGGSAMREKVVRQVARAMQPVLTNVSVDWGQLKQHLCQENYGKNEINLSTQMHMPDSSILNTHFLQCPSVAPAIFMSSRYILHALNVSLPDSVWQQATEGHEVDFSCEICITACSNQHLEKEQMCHKVRLTGEQVTMAGVIHTLAAKERVRELEDEVAVCYEKLERRKLEDEILDLATKFSLSSSRTSFVAMYNSGTTAEEIALSLRASTDDENMIPKSISQGTVFERAAVRPTTVMCSARNYRRRAKRISEGEGASTLFGKAQSLNMLEKEAEQEFGDGDSATLLEGNRTLGNLGAPFMP
ncbi:hypothetical protein L7F22_053338 [Adiantum nelumboides]|nr:hypothetical protein [Adiantum nelumboides]